MSTTYRGYDKPDPDHAMLADCLVLQNALDAIDLDVNNLISSASSAWSNTQASAILTLVKTVDGSGSGLDADLLDGMTSSDFAPATHVGAGAGAHAAATPGAAGFMTTTQVNKLDGIGAGANVISVAGKTGVVTLTATDCSAAADTHVGSGGSAHSAATTASAGFMTTTQVTTLNLLQSLQERRGRSFFMRG